MFLVSILAPTIIIVVLWIASDNPKLSVGNVARLHNTARIIALAIIWGILVREFVRVLLPSPWA